MALPPPWARTTLVSHTWCSGLATTMARRPQWIHRADTYGKRRVLHRINNFQISGKLFFRPPAPKLQEIPVVNRPARGFSDDILRNLRIICSTYLSASRCEETRRRPASPSEVVCRVFVATHVSRLPIEPTCSPPRASTPDMDLKKVYYQEKKPEQAGETTARGTRKP